MISRKIRYFLEINFVKGKTKDILGQLTFANDLNFDFMGTLGHYRILVKTREIAKIRVKTKHLRIKFNSRVREIVK